MEIFKHNSLTKHGKYLILILFLASFFANAFARPNTNDVNQKEIEHLRKIIAVQDSVIDQKFRTLQKEAQRKMELLVP